jgi:hypothetical protein
LAITLLLSTASCRKTPNPEEAHKLLTGKWQLVVKSDCAHWDIDSDTLILHADGRMQQHLKLLNGKEYDSAQERWEYLADRSISLDRRLTVTNPQYAGVPQLEVLIVEFNQPPVILLNPHQNCFMSASRRTSSRPDFALSASFLN